MWHDDHKVKKHKNAQIGTGAIRGLVLSPFQSRAFYGPRPTDFDPSVLRLEGRFSSTRPVITGLSHALSRLRFRGADGERGGGRAGASTEGD